MIFKLEHIGVTVPSLAEASGQLDRVHPCYFMDPGMETGPALRDVSLHQPSRFRISLHAKPGNIGIELIEFPELAPPAGSIYPWNFSPDCDLSELEAAIATQAGRRPEQRRFNAFLSQLSPLAALNAVVVAAEDLRAEERFWQELRFRVVLRNEAISVLELGSLVPPAESAYILIWKGNRVLPCHIDAEGISEIALLCASCRTSLDGFRQNVFRSPVSTFPVNGKEIDLGYLRSPSGALVELFSVRAKSRATRQ